jgi:hypothetical protein
LLGADARVLPIAGLDADARVLTIAGRVISLVCVVAVFALLASSLPSPVVAGLPSF